MTLFIEIIMVTLFALVWCGLLGIGAVLLLATLPWRRLAK